jgi:diguanylate cyclase
MFISGLSTSHRDPLLVRSTIDLAHALEMEVTAEGVDSAAAMALLRVMGCDNMQGFLIAKPMPLGELRAFLDTRDAAGEPSMPIAFPWARSAGMATGPSTPDGEEDGVKRQA